MINNMTKFIGMLASTKAGIDASNVAGVVTSPLTTQLDPHKRN